MNFNEAMLIVPPGHSDTNLLIRSIPDWVTDNELEQEMSMYGTLESKKRMRDLKTGRSLGKAFVRFSEHAAACDAFRTIMQEGLFGVCPTVEWALQQHDLSLTSSERWKRKRLFIRNIPENVTEQKIAELVAPYGRVENVKFHTDSIVTAMRTVYVNFAQEGSASIACDKIDGTYVFGNDVAIMAKVEESKKERSGRSGGGQTTQKNAVSHSSPAYGNGESAVSVQELQHTGFAPDINVASGLETSGSGIINAVANSYSGDVVNGPRVGMLRSEDAQYVQISIHSAQHSTVSSENASSVTSYRSGHSYHSGRSSRYSHDPYSLD